MRSLAKKFSLLPTAAVQSALKSAVESFLHRVKQGSWNMLQRVPWQYGWCWGWICQRLVLVQRSQEIQPQMSPWKSCAGYQVGRDSLLRWECGTFVISRCWAVVPHQSWLLGAGLGREFAFLSSSNNMFCVYWSRMDSNVNNYCNKAKKVNNTFCSQKLQLKWRVEICRGKAFFKKAKRHQRLLGAVLLPQECWSPLSIAFLGCCFSSWRSPFLRRMQGVIWTVFPFNSPTAGNLESFSVCQTSGESLWSALHNRASVHASHGGR